MLDWSWADAGRSVARAGRGAIHRIRLGRRDAMAEDVSPMPDDAAPDMRDAVEALRRAEAASVAKSRFLATVSHEVRTPLNGILGIAELLGGTALDREQSTYVEAIRTSGKALATLIDEILDFSRIEAGKLELSSDGFDLAGVVQGVVELLAPRAQDKGLEIAVYLAPGLPATVTGDAVRLRQVLTNLAGNAVKFTAEGGVGVAVEAAGGGRIRFSVSDTGPGVRADRREAIFQEFEQADGSMARQHGGTGLGLAISRRLVGLMGGDLALEDRTGGGSVFAFDVPLPAVAGSTGGATPHLAGRTVLIVAASHFQAPYLAALLDASGADVALADRVDRAVSWLDGGDVPDVVIVDCALGEAAAERLAAAARRAGVRRTLLLFSPYERRAFGQQLVSGYDGWLVKPVRAASLAAHLAAAGAPRAADPSRPAVRRPAKRGPRVLLAEDNEINALVAVTFLGRLGAQVVHATDGLSALALAKAALDGDVPAFDVILMDVSMPTLDGLEATRRIRQAESERGAAGVRIVALTAHAFQDDHDRCRMAGMDAVLTKPLELHRLGAALTAEPPALRAAS